MAYEFSGQGGRLDFPNPYYAENGFLAIASGVLFTGGLFLLFLSRQSLAEGHGLASWLPLALGVGLLVAGLVFGKRLLSQLRFFFGRNEPASLATDLDAYQAGQSPGSEYLKRIVRQNALEYAEPSGALNGLLYAWMHDLIFAPVEVQHTAQRQFQTAIAIIVTLLSFVISWTGFSDPRAAAWMGLFYFVFSIFLLIRPLDTRARAKVGMRGLIVLILAAIFAPVILPLVADQLPDISWLSLNGQTLFLLLASLLAVAVYFLALIAQMNPPPNTNMACETTALSMNCHPRQLLDELDRNLQEEWTERIPNRHYARKPPVVEGSRGSFDAELVEETQPMPSERERIGLRAALAQPRFRWIAVLDALGVLMAVLGTGWLIWFGAGFSPAHPGAQIGLISLLTLGLAMLTLCDYCLRVGHRLWARIDFTSRLIWVEMAGSYQSSEYSVGNELTTQAKTSTRVIKIETMTLRVWVAEIDSVIFGKRGQRSIIALRGLPDHAKGAVGHLVDFAHGQSIIATPTAAADLEKAKLMGAIGKLAGQAPDNPVTLLDNVQAGQHAAPLEAPGMHCTECGQGMAPGDRFCGHCGAAVAP